MPGQIDHIGIAVNDLDSEIRRYTEELGGRLQLRESLEDIELAFIGMGNTSIELLAPAADSKADSPLRKFITNKGQGLHHLCFKVDDIESELKRLEKTGYRLIDSKPRPGSRKTFIAFIHPKSAGGVLIELCQYI